MKIRGKIKNPLNESIKYINNYLNKKSMVFLITDMQGLDTLDEDLIKFLTYRNDVMIIQVEDVSLFEKKSYDLEKKRYFASMLLHKKKLAELEAQEKDKVFRECENKLIRNKVAMVTIEKNEEIAPKIIELLEKNRNMD